MDEAPVKKVKPHSLESEQALIYCMLQETDAILIASQSITADDFSSANYGIVFQALCDLYNDGKPTNDLVTLQNKLREMNAPAEVSDLSFVKALLRVEPKSRNVQDYIDIVAERALRRNIIKINEDLANSAYGNEETTEYILDDAEKKIFDIIKRRSSGDIKPIREVVSNAINKISLAAKNDGVITGLPTGFNDLDYKTAGLQPSDLILIAARPSMGKTAFVLNLAQHICFKQDKAVLIFSLEMSQEQLVNRLLALESHVEAQKIRNGTVTDKDWEGLVEGASVIGESNLLIDDTPGISIGELRSKCRKYALSHDIKIVIIDYLQLMSGNGKNESRQQEISDISRSLKSLARELNVPVIALSQLSRAVEKRDDHRPMLSDLRESGAIEQDADVVMFLYRDDYYNKETEKKNIAEVIIAKQRNGPIGTTELVWLPELTKFANKARD